MPGANAGAGRRFGTVSNPSIAGRQGGREGLGTALLGQQEPGPGQSSSAGVSSQVSTFCAPNELYVRCLPSWAALLCSTDRMT